MKTRIFRAFAAASAALIVWPAHLLAHPGFHSHPHGSGVTDPMVLATVVVAVGWILYSARRWTARR
jgi:hydrogenase/urease accessory protein HupE